MINDGKETIVPNKEIRIKDLKNGINICHQGLFTKKEIIHNEGYFDLNYPVASDHNFICACFNKGYKIMFSPITIAIFGLGGFSSTKGSYFNETAAIIRKHFGLYYYYKYLFSSVIRNLKKNIKKNKFMRMLFAS